MANHLKCPVLPEVHRIEVGGRFLRTVGVEVLLGVVPRQPEWHDADRRQLGVPRQNLSGGALEHRPVVDPGAQNHLSVHRHSAVEQRT